MRPEAQLTIHQCTLFIADTKLPHYQVIKLVLKYLKGTSMQDLILKPNPEKGIETTNVLEDGTKTKV